MRNLWSKLKSHIPSPSLLLILPLFRPQTRTLITFKANNVHCWTCDLSPNKWTPFSLNLAETYKGGDPAEEDVKSVELVGKEILPWESRSNRTHLHKHGSVLTDMCFINSLQLNSDTSCPVPIPHVDSSYPSAISTYQLLLWINHIFQSQGTQPKSYWLLPPSKIIWAL